MKVIIESPVSYTAALIDNEVNVIMAFVLRLQGVRIMTDIEACTATTNAIPSREDTIP